MAFLKNLRPGEHPRVYNIPKREELSAVINSKTGEIKNKVDIRGYPTADDVQFVSLTSLHVDPLISLLLFPKGDTGWTYSLT